MNPKIYDVDKCIIAIYQVDFKNKEGYGSIPEIRAGIFEKKDEQYSVVAHYNSRPFDNFYGREVEIVVRDDIESPIQLSSVCSEKEIDADMGRKILESYAHTKSTKPLYDDMTILQEMDEFEKKLYANATKTR